MATISGIRGMLLEEAILYLLRVSGYRTVEQADPHDTTLTGNCYSELKDSVRGGSSSDRCHSRYGHSDAFHICPATSC